MSDAQVCRTGRWIASLQLPSGAIPWFDHGHIDPWDHVEAAMGLSLAGYLEEAAAAYEWSARTQRADGSWPIKIGNDETVLDPGTDANFTSYVAVGVWHHWSITGDDQFLHRMWPVVSAALDKVAGMQTADGMIAWAEDADGRRFEEALVSGSSSVFHALTAGVVLAERLGRPRPDWERLRQRIGHDLRSHPGSFADRRRYSMDWYYPMLGGALTGEAARTRIRTDWDRYVENGYGIRCVDDQPWVTGAETAELAITLASLGLRSAAMQLLTDVQHLREPDGSYWTGLVLTDGVRWPVELSSWTAAAMLLAADAITETTPGHRVHRPVGRPGPVDCARCRH
ncbi:prenyltransferase [Naumannella halotolerans]|uniref:prenyltransferase n=1 Tax=Naumannella halotolerans TaxID=993414 RepID=UPI00105CF955|nr:prenyltransferase [Naumannella halotolerans]